MTRRVPLCAALILVVGLLTTACAAPWMQPGHDFTRAAYNPDESDITRSNVSTLTDAWAHTYAGSLSEPVVHQGIVFVVERTASVTNLRAIDLKTGASNWGFSLGPPASFAFRGPIVHTGSDGVARVIVIETRTSDNRVRVAGFEPKTGAVNFSAVVANICGTACGSIEQGAYAEPLGLTGAVVVPRFVAASQCIAGYVVTVPAGATTLWGGACTTDPLPEPIGSRFAATAGDAATTVEAFSSASRVYVFDNCEPVTLFCAGTAWNMDATSPSAPIALGAGPQQIAYVEKHSASTFLEIYRTDGRPAWRGIVPALGLVGMSPAADPDTIWVPHEGGLSAFRAGGCGAATCTRVFFTTFVGDTTAQPALTKELVLVATDGGTPNAAIYAFDRDGCTTPPCAPLWHRSDLGTGNITSLLVADGTVLARTSANQLRAFRLAA